MNLIRASNIEEMIWLQIWCGDIPDAPKLAKEMIMYQSNDNSNARHDLG